MLHIQPVQDLDLPELAPYRSMRWQFEHRRQGIFVAEGEKVVRRLLESNLAVVSLLLPEKWLANYTDLLARRAEEIRAFTAEKAVLEKMTGFSMYQGVLAVGKVPPALSLEHVIETSSQPRLFVAVEGLSNAENLGGLVRNCAAFGAQAIVVGETSCSPWLRRAVRSSMGTIFKLPAVETPSLLQSLRLMRSRGISTIAAHPHTNKKTLSEADFTRDCCIVLGSEGAGISEKILEACDDQVVIPMSNEVDSLNVNTAGAVFLYEASRQRTI
jgi:tRNA G18 (ribose-2'-O)-methylase SpoU